MTLLALDAVNQGKIEIALVLLLNFVLYLRPGEFETLRVGDIMRPVKKGGPIYQFWSILLHPQEEGLPSKTQQWDEALTLDLAYHSYFGAGNGQALTAERPRQENQCLYREDEGGQCLHGKAVGTSQTAGSQEAPSIQASSWRSLSRVGRKASKHPGGADQRTVAMHKVSEELREGRANGPTSRVPRRGQATRMRGGSRKNWQGPPRPALTVGRALTVMVFLEIFSGSGRLGQAIHRAHGWAVLLWDIHFGPEYDLTKRKNQWKIFEWVRCGYIKCGHLGTPCNSFSRARDQPGGPPPVRSDQRPLGLDGLRPHDQLKVQLGNVLMRFTARLLLVVAQYGLAFTLENPARSRLDLPTHCSSRTKTFCKLSVCGVLHVQ